MTTNKQIIMKNKFRQNFLRITYKLRIKSYCKTLGRNNKDHEIYYNVQGVPSW